MARRSLVATEIRKRPSVNMLDSQKVVAQGLGYLD